MLPEVITYPAYYLVRVKGNVLKHSSQFSCIKLNASSLRRMSEEKIRIGMPLNQSHYACAYVTEWRKVYMILEEKCRDGCSVILRSIIGYYRQISARLLARELQKRDTESNLSRLSRSVKRVYDTSYSLLVHSASVVLNGKRELVCHLVDVYFGKGSIRFYRVFRNVEGPADAFDDADALL